MLQPRTHTRVRSVLAYRCGYLSFSLPECGCPFLTLLPTHKDPSFKGTFALSKSVTCFDEVPKELLGVLFYKVTEKYFWTSRKSFRDTHEYFLSLFLRILTFLLSVK